MRDTNQGAGALRRSRGFVDCFDIVKRVVTVKWTRHERPHEDLILLVLDRVFRGRSVVSEHGYADAKAQALARKLYVWFQRGRSCSGHCSSAVGFSSLWV